MDLLVFSNRDSASLNKLTSLIASAVPGVSMTVSLSLEDLERLLSLPATGQKVTVLIMESMKELNAMLLLKDRFWNHKLILVMPDMERKTVAIASKLFPRYMTVCQSGFSDVISVLKRVKTREK